MDKENKIEEDTKEKFYQKPWVIGIVLVSIRIVICCLGFLIAQSIDNDEVEPIQNQDNF